MNSRAQFSTSLSRRMFCATALVSVLALSACSTEKGLEPLSPKVMSDLQRLDLKVGAPLLVRIFKEENEMEVWLQQAYGPFVKFRTYQICSRSGVLGPKLAEGDRQAPEGFYMVSQRQMNPKSKYHLSFNMGYPNAYDKSLDRTGAHLMVHGGCSSRGCYAINDEQVEELFSLAREAFLYGQKEFPVHSFPFRMSEENMIRYDGSPHEGFWRDLKVGNDYFEQTSQPPIVGVKNQRYVFFPHNVSLPPEFHIEQTSADPLAPQLIRGWGPGQFQ
ncbi:MAG: murein L,D-transpeptidase family protein [Anderseniella sp.]